MMNYIGWQDQSDCFVKINSANTVDRLNMIYLRPWFGLAVRLGYFFYPTDGFGAAYFGKSSCIRCIVPSVLDRCVPMTNSVYRRKDSCGLMLCFCPCRLFSASVLGVCMRFVLHRMNCRKEVPGVSCLISWFLVAVFAIIVVLFNGFQYCLQFQRSFFELVSGFLVLYCCCNLVCYDLLRCYSAKFTVSFNIH